MAFTFQINRDVKFNHNEGLLEKRLEKAMEAICYKRKS